MRSSLASVSRLFVGSSSKSTDGESSRDALTAKRRRLATTDLANRAVEFERTEAQGPEHRERALFDEPVVGEGVEVSRVGGTTLDARSAASLGAMPRTSATVASVARVTNGVRTRGSAGNARPAPASAELSCGKAKQGGLADAVAAHDAAEALRHSKREVTKDRAAVWPREGKVRKGKRVT